MTGRGTGQWPQRRRHRRVLALGKDPRSAWSCPSLTQTGALYIIGTLFFVALVAVILSFLNIIPRGAGIGTVIVCVLCFIGVYAGPYILKGLSSWAMH